MPWPTHADGTNKSIGEMTAEERAAVIKASTDRIMTGRKPD